MIEIWERGVMGKNGGGKRRIYLVFSPTMNGQ